MGDTFDNFSEKTSFSPNDRLVGFDSTVLGGEKKWTYRTLITSISSQMVNSGACIDTGVRSVTGNFFPIAGGTVTGASRFNNDVTIIGNLSATGNSYFANTIYSTTSALSVINIGNTGPALYVGNDGTGDLASFYDLDTGIEVLHIGGSNGTFPNVGIKVSNPTETLTVNGTISAKGLIYSQSGPIKPLSGIGGIVVNNTLTGVTVVSASGGIGGLSSDLIDFSESTIIGMGFFK